jgi:hypothetical protein
MSEVVSLRLRIPAELHQAATTVADAMGLSLNTFILHAVQNWTLYQHERVRKGQAPAFPSAWAEPGGP